jgi:hypothetical protein
MTKKQQIPNSKYGAKERGWGEKPKRQGQIIHSSTANRKHVY